MVLVIQYTLLHLVITNVQKHIKRLSETVSLHCEGILVEGSIHTLWGRREHKEQWTIILVPGPLLGDQYHLGVRTVSQREANVPVHNR